MSWPWSRRRWTQPDRRASLPDVGGSQLPAGVGPVGRGEARAGVRHGRRIVGERTRPRADREIWGRVVADRRGGHPCSRSAASTSPFRSPISTGPAASRRRRSASRPFSVQPEAVLYRAGDGTALRRRRRGAPCRAAAHTQMAFTGHDLEAEVAEPRARGDRLRGVRPARPQDGDGDRPVGPERAAWFLDREGNLIGVIEFADATVRHPAPPVSRAGGLPAARRSSGPRVGEPRRRAACRPRGRGAGPRRRPARRR